MTKLPKTVGIAGGIGAGKSIVSRMLSVMGYPVYDTDARARAIMDFSDDIKAFLCREIHPDAVDACGAIDRRLVGEVVFACDEKRLKLNGAVHDAVREDLRKWVISHAGSDVVFVECAIMCESGIAEMVDAIWVVEAPEALRVDRICRRNGSSRSRPLRAYRRR